MEVEDFIRRWKGTESSERANKDSFLKEFCRVLRVSEPNPKTGEPDRDSYVFEADARLQHEGGQSTVGKIDLYRRDCFILEAKQAANPIDVSTKAKRTSAKKKATRGSPRGLPGWNIAMMDAQGQAVRYAKTLEEPPPFLIVADLGYCFDLFACFDGSGIYRKFLVGPTHRLYMDDLRREDVRDTFRAIWNDPHSLDPRRREQRVTLELIEEIANLRQELVEEGHAPEHVARFLMRCIFTMFAEDVGLLNKEQPFTQGLERLWIPHPERFKPAVEKLWAAMNIGDDFFLLGKLLHFNGGLFADATAVALDVNQLRLLLKAAKYDWAFVEPSIFGALLERTLDPVERHKLGAHFTPSDYVERLLVPTIEKPLRAEWDLVRVRVRELVPPDQPASKESVKAALNEIRAFHKHLCNMTVLDPACGTGNFLFVALAIFKRIESEVIGMLHDLGPAQTELGAELMVTPAQFLGLEVRDWAKQVAELVLWIGYLQWHQRQYGGARKPPEPVMKDYKNIRCEDAVLGYDRREPRRDERGKPLTRWNGRTFKKNAITGEDVPDENAREPVYTYVSPRPAKWPRADFIVGNPPFVGNKRMRLTLGDGYVEALRAVYPSVPETADFVMYWWDKAANLVADDATHRAGLITTNSITQVFSRRLVETHLRSGRVSLAFAVPDHPWVDSTNGAAVRISMSVMIRGDHDGVLGEVVEEVSATDTEEARLTIAFRQGRITPALTIGADKTAVQPLRANADLSFMGLTLIGEGFRIDDEDGLAKLGVARHALPSCVRPYIMGRDLAQRAQERWVIDFFGRTQPEARREAPRLFQRVIDRVKPERDQNPRKAYRERWWIFGEPRERMRSAVDGLDRYIATARTARYRVFQFVPSTALVDSNVIAIASADAFVLGVLSSRPHLVWADSLGATLEDRPHYTSSTTFEPFPFPEEGATAKKIRELGETIDEHRQRIRRLFPEMTMTAVYSVVEKLRSGAPLEAKEKIVHEKALVSVLADLHEQLDRAVLSAYGWSFDASNQEILDNLIRLNATRIAEEAAGRTRYLRSEYQLSVARPARPSQPVNVTAAAKTLLLPWPKELPKQVEAVRNLISASDTTWHVDGVAARYSGAKTASVVTALQTLEVLGLAASFDDGAARKWKGLAKTSGERQTDRASSRPPSGAGKPYAVSEPPMLMVADSAGRRTRPPRP